MSRDIIVVKGGMPKISEILNDCVSLCVPTYKNESLASILQKMCNKMTECCGEGGNLYYLQAGDNVTVTGDGSVDSPWVVSSQADDGQGFTAFDTLTLNLSGDGSAATPLFGDVNVDPAIDNAIQITPLGLYVQNVIQNGIVYGGIVTWLGDYDYHVSAAGYWINFQYYESPAADFTLSAPDATDNRIDTFILTTDGIAAVLEGTPSGTPAQAPLDPATQLEISLALVEVGTTEPTLSAECLYRNNAEWGTSANNIVRMNADSTTFPCNSTKAIEGTGVINNDFILLDRGTSFSPTTLHSQLDFYIRSKSSFGTSKLTFQWELAGVPVGLPVQFQQSVGGFDSLQTSTCQLIAIPLFQFGLTNSSVVDSLRITASIVSGTLGFYIDDLCLQGQPLPPSPVSVDEKVKVSSNDTTPGFLLTKLVAGTNISFTENNNGGNETLTITALAADVLTFDNALLRTADNVQFGGNPLLHDTVIPTSIYNLDIASSNATATLSLSNSSGGGYGLYSTTTGVAVVGESTSDVGVLGRSTNSTGGYFQTGNFSVPAGEFYSLTANTAGTVPLLNLYSLSTGTAANNIGGKIQFFNELNNGSGDLANSVISRFSNNTSGSQTSRFIITGKNLGSIETDLLTLQGSGQLRLNLYDGNNFTGTATGYLAVDASGNIIEEPVPSIPTITADNGLNEALGNIQLGGPLTETTTITSTGFDFLVTSNDFFGIGDGSMVFENTSTGNAVYASAGSGAGSALRGVSDSFVASIYGYNANFPAVRGDTDDGYGGSFIASASGVGVAGSSQTGTGGSFGSSSGQGIGVSSITNEAAYFVAHGGTAPGTVQNIMTILRNATTHGVDTGGAIRFQVAAQSGNGTTHRLISKIINDATVSGYDSEFSIERGHNNSVMETIFVLGENGELRLNKYGTGARTAGAATFALNVDANGNVIEVAIGAGMTNPMAAIGALITSSDGAGTPVAINPGTAGFVLTSNGVGAQPTWQNPAGGAGTVTTVGFTGGLISVANPTTTPAFTVAGTSGGIPYFSSASTWASSAALAANSLVIGGGAGVAPSTTTTGANVLTALGVAVGSAGAFVVNGGALGTPSSGTISTGVTLGNVTIDVTGTDATGDIYYRSAGGLLTRLGIGSGTQVLGVSAGLPAWVASGTGTVTTVSGGTTGLTFNTPTTTPTMTGTLNMVNGGLGFATIAQGDLMFGSAANVISKLGKDTNATRYLSNTGASNNPAWAQINLANGVTGRLPNANLAQANARSVQGNPTNAVADLQNIGSSAANQILRSDPTGTTLGFGAINLASVNAVGTSILPAVNGGIGFGVLIPSAIPIATSTTTWSLATPTGSNGVTVTMGPGSMGVSLTVNPTRVTLVDGATITWTLSNGSAATVTLGNVGRTLALASSPVNGTTYTLEVRQDGTGNRTITTWPAGILWEGGSVPTLSTGANKIDLFTFYHTTGGQYLGKLVGRFN